MGQGQTNQSVIGQPFRLSESVSSFCSEGTLTMCEAFKPRLAEFLAETRDAAWAREVEPLIARSNVTVTATVPAGLPVVRSDRQKVKQILLNLLTNALKFTRRGSVTVSCAHRRRNGTVAIAVADTGIGIAPHDQERIFEAFSQADSSSAREGSGSGLGLAICQRLATVLGGQITVESAVGKGSTFTLVLPVGPSRP